MTDSRNIYFGCRFSARESPRCRSFPIARHLITLHGWLLIRPSISSQGGGRNSLGEVQEGGNLDGILLAGGCDTSGFPSGRRLFGTGTLSWAEKALSLYRRRPCVNERTELVARFPSSQISSRIDPFVWLNSRLIACNQNATTEPGKLVASSGILRNGKENFELSSRALRGVPKPGDLRASVDLPR